MFYDDQSIAFLDGEFVRLSDAHPHLLSQTLHYGNGVFEGIRSYETPDGTRLFRARQHFQRLLDTAERIHINVPYAKEELTKISYELLYRNGLTEAYLRPFVFVGENMSLTATRTSHICISTWTWGKLLGDQQLNLMIATLRRPDPRTYIPDAKISGYYVNNIMATSEAKAKGYDDCLMLDVDDNVACGAGANIFIEKDEVLYTPASGHIVSGITRKVIMELAHNMGIEIREQQVGTDLLFSADGAFLTGTATEVAAVGTVNDKSFQMKWEDTIGYVLSRKYRQLVTRSGDHQYTLI